MLQKKKKLLSESIVHFTLMKELELTVAQGIFDQAQLVECPPKN